jgi:hypothetical protein
VLSRPYDKEATGHGTHGDRTVRVDTSARERRLRLIACLAHVVPGVTVELRFGNDESVHAAHHRLGADLDPCQLRGAVLAPVRLGVPRLVDVISSADITGGVEHLGAGIYRRHHPCGSEERWFLAELGHDRVVDLLAACPFDAPDELVDVTVMPDLELGVCAVRLVVGSVANAWRIDEIAIWGATACMVEEVIGAATSDAR